MKKLLQVLTEEFEKAFEAHDYDKKLAKVVVSNRPDLCQYQCNGAMAGAKIYKKAPIMIANEIVEDLKDSDMFSTIEAVMPGFININLSSAFVAQYLNEMKKADCYGCQMSDKTVVVDYGGPNVAKPLHIGHLRSAVIGESIKRIKKYVGNKTIGDIHLGDWGLQMGLIITELECRKPDLVYFDESYTGEYPTEAPFTLAELEEIYPCASGKSKKDEAYLEKAHQATLKLQSGYAPYTAIWKHIMDISVSDLKKNYSNLNVDFEVWKGESDAQPLIPALIQDLIDKGLAYESQGALVVDVAKEDDKKELPPCIVRKSDGAALYATSDLGTIIQRERDYQPDEYIYLTDKRQELHFTQVFRVAKKAGFVSEDKNMEYIGFGTMNGKDGKPFKTRDGGLMSLKELINQIKEKTYELVSENIENKEEVSHKVAIAALKYADLLPTRNKDYIFDIEKFCDIQGKTGPYILYSTVRIKSLLKKANIDNYQYINIYNDYDLSVVNHLLNLTKTIDNALKSRSLNDICEYLFKLNNSYNNFYNEYRILTETDAEKKNSWLALSKIVYDVNKMLLDVLAIDIPDKM